MPAPLTITISEAAAALNAPKAAIERAVEAYGLVIPFGNRKRIDPNDVPEIMELCRNKPRNRASIVAQKLDSGSSVTPGALNRRSRPPRG